MKSGKFIKTPVNNRMAKWGNKKEWNILSWFIFLVQHSNLPNKKKNELNLHYDAVYYFTVQIFYVWIVKKHELQDFTLT